MIRTMMALALAGALVGGQALAQTPAKAKPAAATKARAGGRAVAYRAPRGPDGKHPDLNGVWQVMNTAGWNIEPHPSSAALQMRPGPVVPVPAKEVVALGAVGSVPAGLGVVEGGTIPYKPEALKQRDANRADWIHKDPEIKCYLPGVPRANYMDLPFQIFQSESAMLIAYEYAGAVRNLLFKDPGPAPVDSWMGQSVAHWEGDTLVVVVTGMLLAPALRQGVAHAQARGVDGTTEGVCAALDLQGAVSDPAQRIWAQTEYARALALRGNRFVISGDRQHVRRGDDHAPDAATFSGRVEQLELDARAGRQRLQFGDETGVVDQLLAGRLGQFSCNGHPIIPFDFRIVLKTGLLQRRTYPSVHPSPLPQSHTR